MASIIFIVLTLVLSSAFFVTSSPLLSLPVDGTACNWNVWDDTVEEKSIQKILIRCSEGEVIWRTPYGGLAIDFLPPLKSHQFEVCFIAHSTFATLQFFMEGNQTLNRLAVLNGIKSSWTREICLKSNGDEPVVIFIETDSSSSSPVHGKMVLEYDVQTIQQSVHSIEQECRPCSDEETIMAACTADYAVVGEIHSISKILESNETELHVIASHVIRQRHHVVKDSVKFKTNKIQHIMLQSLKQSNHSLKVTDRNKLVQNRRIVRDSVVVKSPEDETNYNFSVVIPEKCQIKQGSGVFLFLGSVRLKRARLGCAPWLDEFKRIWDNAVATESNPCVL